MFLLKNDVLVENDIFIVQFYRKWLDRRPISDKFVKIDTHKIVLSTRGSLYQNKLNIIISNSDRNGHYPTVDMTNDEKSSFKMLQVLVYSKSNKLDKTYTDYLKF